ncbi:uncharacterized protein LOC105664722 [Ceratitis capitata]|uniref:uncharacterized protein LOC105664722 n=1 Tax=Ceratitis capitata TaxID=7213 RepID=UPI000A0FEC48|nr:uncharacterized protein LOC105664722 [Ceratitis capitata]
MLKICKINACPNGTLGLHLSRAPWDPYPWVSGIQEGSSAEEAGMRVGDTVLEFNGNDVLGQKILEIANRIRAHWQSGATDVTVVIWRNQTELDNDCSDGGYEDEEQEDNGTVAEEQRKQRVQRSHQQHSSINQQSLQKFATCLQHIAQLLECPVCLEVIRPPGWQCCNGHVLCNNCRSRSVKCPVCRVPLGPRGRCLLADKLFTVLAESFPCDGVRSNRNSPKGTRKCSPELKGAPKACVTTQKHQQREKVEQQKQQIKSKEMQQQDKRKVKSVAAASAAIGSGQRNVSLGKVAVKESTTTLATATNTAGTVLQEMNNCTNSNNNNNINCNTSKSVNGNSRKSSSQTEEAENGSSSQGCHWQWRKSRTRVAKEQQQQQ